MLVYSGGLWETGKTAMNLILAALLLPASIQAPPAKSAAPSARQPGLYATIQTSMGSIVCRLFEKEAPETVANFVGLARGTKEWTDPKTGQKVKRPLYPGTTFHRVIPDFMIQGGDPRGDGTGDPGYSIKDEIVPSLNFDQPGRLAMANTDRPGTGGCQFFITEVPYPSLNQKYTIFGQVVEGQELVTTITRVTRDRGNDRPRTPVVIKTIRIGRYPLAAPAKKAPAKKVPAKTAPPKKAP